jgi:hypothetical protein
MNHLVPLRLLCNFSLPCTSFPVAPFEYAAEEITAWLCLLDWCEADQSHWVSKDHIKQTRAHRSKIGLIVTFVSLLVLFQLQLVSAISVLSLCCLCAVSLCLLFVCQTSCRTCANLLSAVSVLPLYCLCAASLLSFVSVCLRLHFVSSLHFRPLQTHHQVALVSVSVLQRLRRCLDFNLWCLRWIYGDCVESAACVEMLVTLLALKTLKPLKIQYLKYENIELAA